MSTAAVVAVDVNLGAVIGPTQRVRRRFTEAASGPLVADPRADDFAGFPAGAIAPHPAG